jgi:hypothetical protein
MSEINKVQSVLRSQLFADSPLVKASRPRGGKGAVALVLSVLLILLASGLGTLASISAAGAEPVPWHIMTSPDTSSSVNNQLLAVSCTSPTSCVAVGYYSNGPAYQTLMETLSGGSWSLTEGPDTSTTEDNYLYGVSCTSSTSCVAVGNYDSASGYNQTLIETLTGTTWSITSSPNTSSSEDNTLSSVSCTSSTSCVAVGDYSNGGVYQTLMETLSGGSWSLTEGPDTSTTESNYLSGVSCTSSTSCVAVGNYFNGTNSQNLIVTLSGTTWSITTSPDTSTSDFDVLYAVSCTSSTSCVAVGFYSSGSPYQTIMLTLSGTSWTLTEGPDTSTSDYDQLYGVSCTSSTSCVAIGFSTTGSGVSQTLIETLSGGSWSLTSSPDTSTTENNYLSGVSCTSSTSCVTVGNYYNGSDFQNLILSTPLSQTITFSPPPPTSALFGSTLTLSATGGGSGNPVTFTDSSPDVCSISSTEEASSPYQATIVFIGAGTCVMEANQAGNNTYFAAPQVTVDIPVTYSEPCLSLSGYHGLTVRSGQAICVSSGAFINGTVNVQSGGSLDIEGARVNGPISSNGAGVVRICDSNINGSVSVSSTTGLVLVGGLEGSNCAGNTIRGPVTVTNNTAGIEFDYNTVDGPLTITGNTGSFGVFGDMVTGTENVQ